MRMSPFVLVFNVPYLRTHSPNLSFSRHSSGYYPQFCATDLMSFDQAYIATRPKLTFLWADAR